MERATEVLEREHRIIQKAVAVMAQLVAQLELRHVVSPEVLRDLLTFMREFSDQVHHGKEESYFFPYLEKKGVPSTGCPLSALKGEHVKSRQLMDELNSAAGAYIEGSEGGRLTLIQVLQSLVALYPAHIWKEDFLLFPMADKILADTDQELLLRQFDSADEALGGAVHERFEKLADELSARIDHCPQCDQQARRT